MKTILITTEFTEEEKAKAAEIAAGHHLIYKGSTGFSPEEIEQADAVLGNFPPRDLAAARSLKWLQLQMAGTDGYLKPGILPEKVVLTNVTGAFGESIAEYVLGAVLLLKNHFHTYIRRQSQKSWAKIPVTNLKGSTVLLLGLGDIGRETAKRMKAMGAYVIAVKRRPSERPDYVDELYYEAELDRVIPRADVFVLTIPMYAEVRHIISQRRIALMKPSALLVNIARGGLIDQDALIAALQQGKIAGAALDVFEQEPLPEDSPLWELENILLTPHNAGGFSSPMAREKIGQIMLDNLERYLTGQPLKNVIDKKNGYCL